MHRSQRLFAFCVLAATAALPFVGADADLLPVPPRLVGPPPLQARPVLALLSTCRARTFPAGQRPRYASMVCVARW